MPANDLTELIEEIRTHLEQNKNRVASAYAHTFVEALYKLRYAIVRKHD